MSAPVATSHDGHGGLAGHDVAGQVVLDGLVVVLLLAVALGYGLAVLAARHRGRWPAHRTVLLLLGLGCVGAALVGPVAAASRSSFTGHMAGHLLLGMLGPLLLVRAAPVTAALRALPARQARRLTRLLRSRYVRVLTHPVVAATLDLGGLWLLYTTGVYAAVHGSVLLWAAVHAHVLAAGYLFTASVVGVDPDPHRASVRLRAVVLVGFLAGHSVLSKWLYAHPPAGVDADDARLGAQLMYYGGDVVHVTLVVLLLAGWYAATAPGRRPAPRARTAPGRWPVLPQPAGVGRSSDRTSSPSWSVYVMGTMSARGRSRKPREP